MQKEILDLKRIQKELELQNKIAKIFVTVPNGYMYKHVLEIVLEELNCLHGAFGYIDHSTGDLVCPSMTKEVWWKKCDVVDKNIVFPKDCWKSVWGTAMTNKKTYFVNDDLNVPEGHLPIANCLAVPIIYNKELIGLITVADKSGTFGSDDVKILENICNQIAPLLNARLQRDFAIESLQDAVQKAQTYLKIAPAVFVALDSEGYITLINDYGSDLLGCGGTSCIGKNWFDNFVHVSDRVKLKLVFKDLMEGNTKFIDYENSVITVTGKKRIISWKNTILKDKSGNITGTLSAGDDITEQRNAELALEEYWSLQEKELEKGLNSLSLLHNSNGED